VNQKAVTVILVVAAVVIVLVFLVLPSPPTPATPTSAAKHAPAGAPAVTYSADLDNAAGAAAPDTSSALPSASSAMPWEDRLDALLTADTDNATMVRGMVSSMRDLPPEAQEEFVAHAVNLCEDEQYEMLARIYLDPRTPKPVSETIFNDALNRPDEIKLPLLVQTLRNATHPMSAEAREILEMYLDLQPGTVPPGGWDQAVAAYLKEQGAP
jgi:hypothetical protein